MNYTIDHKYSSKLSGRPLKIRDVLHHENLRQHKGDIINRSTYLQREVLYGRPHKGGIIIRSTY